MLLIFSEAQGADTHAPQNFKPRNLIKVDPNFLEKIFLDSARKGLSNDISFGPYNDFWGISFFGPKFPSKFQKIITFFLNHFFARFKVLLVVE